MSSDLEPLPENGQDFQEEEKHPQDGGQQGDNMMMMNGQDDGQNQLADGQQPDNIPIDQQQQQQQQQFGYSNDQPYKMFRGDTEDAASLSSSTGMGGTSELPDGFAPVPSLPMVYKWMVSSIGESMAQAMPMSVRVSMPLDTIQSIAQGISLRDPSKAVEIWKNLWITAHTRHFHGVIVLGWAKMQNQDACNPECCPKMIIGKSVAC